MRKRDKKKQQQDTQPVVPLTIDTTNLQEQIKQLQALLQEERDKNEKVFSQLHAKQREVEEASKDSRALRDMLTAEKVTLQQLAEIAQTCAGRRILEAHRWHQEGQYEAYSLAAKIIGEALSPTVTSPPPRVGLLKAQQQMADFIIQAYQELVPTDDGSGPGIEKGHEFPNVPCPFCDTEPKKNWLSRHIKEEHPRRYDKWERERDENE